MIFGASKDRIQCRFGRGDVELGAQAVLIKRKINKEKKTIFFFLIFEDQNPESRQQKAKMMITKT